MSAALAVGAGSFPVVLNPFRGAAPALRPVRTRVQQAQSALRGLTGRIKAAADAVDGLRPAADQGGAALRQVKANADAAARSITRTGQTGADATPGIRSASGKPAAKALATLGSAAAGLLSLVAGLVDIAGIVGDLMGAFGTAMTIGSGVMLVVNALTRANPIGFVTGLLLPVAGWLLDLALNSETGQRLMEQLATIVLKYVELYLTILTPLLKAIGGAVNLYVTGYLAVITGAITAIGTVLGLGFAALRALTTGDTRALSGRVSSVWRGFKSAVKPALDWITKDIPRMFTRIKEATSRTLGAMGDFVTTGAQTVAGVVKGPISGLIAFANWVIDGLKSLSVNILGKKFGVDLDKIPMLAEGGVAVPGATARTGRVLPLTALARQRTLAARAGTARHRSRVEEFHESRTAGPRGTAEDLLFLAAAHARP
jgi:hypothetical protein